MWIQTSVRYTYILVVIFHYPNKLSSLYGDKTLKISENKIVVSEITITSISVWNKYLLRSKTEWGVFGWCQQTSSIESMSIIST